MTLKEALRGTPAFPVLRLANRLVSPVFSPRQAARAVKSVPWFFRSRAEYAKRSPGALSWMETYPMLTDRDDAAGAQGHYFYQDIWAARRVRASGRARHVDVGSSVGGFVAHCACFTRVVYVDIRPLETDVDTIEPMQGSVLALPFADRTVDSLSSLHVVEHVGLGRYGDPIDPDGSHKAMRELARVLAPGGDLYFGIPVGKERVCFNAHRVFDPRTIVRAFAGLELVAFAAVGDDDRLHDPARPEDWVDADFACGLFHFRRPAG